MNKTIDQLYEQAYESVQQQIPTHLITSQMIYQAFAQLIGTQCYEIVRDQLVYDEDGEETKELTYNDGVTDAAMVILMYLGELK